MAMKNFIPENNISLKGTVELGSDKSLSIRAVLFASIAYGISKITILNPGEDAKTAVMAVQKLGIKIIKEKNHYTIFGLGIGYGPKKKQITIDCRNSGTTLRLLTPLIAGSNLNAKIVGDKSLSARPYRLEFLKEFLMDVRPTNKQYLPLSIRGHSNCIQTEIKINKPSAQMVSAATLAGIMSYGETVIECPNNVRDHTNRILKYLGYPIKIKNKKNTQIIKVQGRRYLKELQNYQVPSDPSSSAFIIAIAILTKGSHLKIKNVCLNEFRIGFIKILKRMGAKIVFQNKKNYFGETVGDIIASYSPNLKGVTIKSNEVASAIDEIPVLAVVALFCKSKSYFNDLTELKYKESNRLEVIYKNLKLCGADIIKQKDNLIINGLTENFYSSQTPIIKDFKSDHRIAMAFYVLAAVSRKKIQINDFDCINVSFPNFLNTIQNLKNNKDKKIILACDGGVATGKTSILKRVSKHYKSKAAFIDSGLLYRYLTLVHLKKGKSKINVDYLIKELKKITIKKLQNPNLHSNTVSNKVSDIAKIPKIREALLPVQRDLIFNSDEKIMLVGGRDICSKILPGAFSDLKLFIDADVKLRAKRRYLELLSNKKERKIEYQEILNALKARDSADKNRKVSPLKKTRDSVLINNNSNDISRPVKRIIDLLEKEIKKH
jgi:3-phosphoshikimate 1-carboxyvinyltransferase